MSDEKTAEKQAHSKSFEKMALSPCNATQLRFRTAQRQEIHQTLGMPAGDVKMGIVTRLERFQTQLK